jgi:hypothetical protein
VYILKYDWVKLDCVGAGQYLYGYVIPMSPTTNGEISPFNAALQAAGISGMSFE